MSGGPPFERYPGPPRRDGASYRVISPWRDALAWVSTTGRLTITSYLVREGDGWRDVLPETAAERPSSGPMWRLERRDPVELVFTASPPGVAIMATVSVTRERCEVHLTGSTDPAGIREFLALPAGAVVVQDSGDTVVQIRCE